MFVSRMFQYSLKHLANGAARVYIKNSDALQAANFNASDSISTKIEKHKVTIKKVAGTGDMIVKNTQRGALVEIRNKKLAVAFKGIDRVTVTLRSNVITIQISKADKARLEREQTLLRKLINDTPLSFGSMYSGLALLSLAIKEGMERSGIRTQHAFSTDKEELPITIQLESNPIWDNPAANAVAIVDDISELDTSLVPQLDVIELGYPCWGMSKLCQKNLRDTRHPLAGAKFIPTVNKLRALNPAVIILECSVPFLSSDTYALMKRELPGYTFSETKINGYENGDFEERERCAVTAISSGLPSIGLHGFTPPARAERMPISSIMENIEDSSPLWKRYEHVVSKLNDSRLNFKHNLYKGHEDKIAAIPATYNSPKIGSPMIAHWKDKYQRLITWLEHSRIRMVPAAMEKVLEDVTTGKHPLVSTRGNVTVVHQMLGNSVSPKAWRNFGEFVGTYLKSLKFKIVKSNPLKTLAA